MRNTRHDFRIRPQEPSLEPVETREDWEAEERAQEGEGPGGCSGAEPDAERESHADN